MNIEIMRINVSLRKDINKKYLEIKAQKHEIKFWTENSYMQTKKTRRKIIRHEGTNIKLNVSLKERIGQKKSGTLLEIKVQNYDNKYEISKRKGLKRKRTEDNLREFKQEVNCSRD